MSSFVGETVDGVWKPSWLFFLAVAAAIIFVAALPMLVMLLSTWIASANGCTLNEANAHPCIVWGVDLGEALAAGFVTAWLGLLTLPMGALGLFAWVVAFSVLRIVAWRKTRAANPG
jgi:hypothetical protein